jgi:hypothetical protein
MKTKGWPWGRKRGRGVLPLAALAFAFAFATVDARAQASGTAGAQAARPSAATRPAITTAQDELLIRRLVVQTLIALHQANETGEYATFRALAAPAFQQRNSTAQLAQTFRPLRDGGVDLGVAAVVAPTLNPAPFLDADNRLMVQGTLPIPQPGGQGLAAYAMVFVPLDGVWRLQEIAVGDANSGRPAGPAPR